MPDIAPEQADMILRAIAEAADNASLGVSVTSLDGDEVRIVFVNQAMLAMLGAPADEVRARGVWGFIAQDDLPRLMKMRDERAAGAELPNVFETTLARKDGTRLPVEISTTRVTLDGKPGNVTFVSDISALSRSEERFRRLIESAPDGVVILRWPTVLFMNREAGRMLGLRDPSEAIGKSLMEYMEPAEIPEAEMRAREALGTDVRRAPREYTGRDLDGNKLTVEVSAIPIEYEGAPAMLAFSRDVTYRKAMFTKLARADKLAAVGTLAAGVAHEINNPLGYLLLNLGLLRREIPKLGGDGERVAALMDRLDQCMQGAERVKTIVHDLQAFTRKDEDIRGPVDLGAVVVAATQLARHHLRDGTRISHDFEQLPPAHGNATRFEQLVLNLLINAAHAIEQTGREDGEIRVKLRRALGPRLLLEVRDNGAGMTPELQAHVFEPFFTTKPPGVGTGLGLPICHGIARAVGGDITLDSEPGVGTTVTVELPMHGGAELEGAAAGAGAPDTAPDDTLANAAASAATAVGRDGRLLIIDDEKAVLASLSAALDDYDVVTCSNAGEARELLDREERFDVVICDLMLRGDSGMDVYHHAVSVAPELARRFIFMTGGAYRKDAQDFLRSVDSPHLDKPFELAELQQAVSEMLSR